MSNHHRALLQRTRALCNRHSAYNESDSFNIFSILRDLGDEVNLHSRFLAALLDHRSPDANRSNLADFLHRFLRIDNFGHTGASIVREYDEIDILICSGDRRMAVVIENKIWAADQPQQLMRYHKTAHQLGFQDVSLVYLTLDGRAPSPDSIGDLHHERLSYGRLIPWLMDCHKHAQAEPSVRESIAQYICVIRKLTGTDSGGTYMNDLRDLCLESENILLAYDLRTAMEQAHIKLLHDLWDKIEREVRKTMPDLPRSSWMSAKGVQSISDPIQESEPNIALFVNQRSAELVLRFPIGETDTGVGIGADSGSTFFGVYCHKCDTENRMKLKEVFRNIKGSSSDRWAWYRFCDVALSKKDATRAELQMLLNGDRTAEFAQRISFDLMNMVWRPMRDAGIL